MEHDPVNAPAALASPKAQKKDGVVQPLENGDLRS